jgi:choice-of-anchor B domain-containing protein
MKRPLLLATSIALLLAASAALHADSDEPALLVSASGSDVGNCQTEPCQSLSYALNQVSKNGQIQVGDGSFEVSNVADVVYMLSGAIDVRGSYAAGTRSTLIGVPSEFAAALEAKGFGVVVDSKGLYRAAVATQLSVQSDAFATACVGGFAGSFPCSDVDLLSHISTRTPGARGADIWGFVDLNTRREYAIIGYSTGTAVFDVSDAENPREVGFINGQTTTWRDIKVYQFWNATDGRWNAYAYISADNASDGLFIIDLSNLPHRVSRVSYSSDFSAAHNVYLTDVDFSTGLSISGDTPNLILAGSNLSDGRFRVYSLDNPTAPTFIAAPATPANQPGGNRLYMHDAASMVVTDSRKDTQCVNAGASDHCDILFDFNESTVDIWDVTIPATPARLSQLPYDNASYTHSGWPSEDQQFLFIQDELDERDRGLATTLRSVSIANLTAPTLAGSWTGPTRAIDHNGFARGNRYYMSNYSRGLSILDITDASAPTLAGRFDTYPASDGVGFPGNWGTYPFLPSGNVALSDIDSGFYMVQDNTLDVPQGTLSFSASSFAADETQSLSLVVSRTGGSQGAASVRWELLGGTADSSDVTVSSGQLNWADGDSSERTISIGLENDGIAEGLEQLFVKLSAPTGGATVTAPFLASAYISDPGATASVDFSSANVAVAERGFGLAIATVRRSGSANGALSVDYTIVSGDASNGSDYSGPASGTLNWADGDADPKLIEYAITDDGSGEPDEFFEIELGNVAGGALGTNTNLVVEILDGTNSAPNSVAGSSQTVRPGTTVTLNGSGSNDPDGDTLSYAWSQTQGPAVSLSNANTISASFTAPSITSDTLLRFQLLVADARGLSDTSLVSVTISQSGGAVGDGGGGGVFDLLAILALLGLSVLSRKGAS